MNMCIILHVPPRWDADDTASCDQWDRMKEDAYDYGVDSDTVCTDEEVEEEDE